VGPNVAFFLPSLSGGGAEHAIVSLAEEFVERGLTVDVVLASAVGPYLNRVQQVARIVDLRAPRILRATLPLARYLRAERPSAMLSTLPHANVVAVAARRVSRTQVRLVLREGNDLFARMPEFRSVRDRVMPIAARVAYPRCDVVAVNSRAMADRLRVWRGMEDSGHVRAIGNPIATSRVLELAAEKSPHEWFKPFAPPVVLSVGRLEPQKDVATLVRAFAIVRRRRPARLAILGQGSQLASLESLATELGLRGDVILPGFVGNPYAWMQRASVLALSSLWEGSPNVLVEAMLLGVPIVSTECPGTRELLLGGELGRLTHPGDVEALASAILEALDSPRDGSRMRLAVHRNDVRVISDEFLQALGLQDDVRRHAHRASIS
jgi:glycosyltransferase involved in cell wall biosynthesis